MDKNDLKELLLEELDQVAGGLAAPAAGGLAAPLAGGIARPRQLPLALAEKAPELAKALEEELAVASSLAESRELMMARVLRVTNDRFAIALDDATALALVDAYVGGRDRATAK